MLVRQIDASERPSGQNSTRAYRRELVYGSIASQRASIVSIRPVTSVLIFSLTCVGLPVRGLSLKSLVCSTRRVHMKRIIMKFATCSLLHHCIHANRAARSVHRTFGENSGCTAGGTSTTDAVDLERFP